MGGYKSWKMIIKENNKKRGGSRFASFGSPRCVRPVFSGRPAAVNAASASELLSSGAPA